MANLTFDDALRTDLAPRAIDFPETSFFQTRTASGCRPTLPSTEDVCSRSKNGQAAYPDLGLFVKFGPAYRVPLEEAQSLQALRRAFPNNEIPVPELFGWRSEEDTNFIYMSLIEGVTLQSCWPSLELSERTAIADDLARIFEALRKLRLRPGTDYIGALDHGPVQAIYFRGETVGPFLGPKEFYDAIQYWALPWLPLSQRPPDPFRHLLPDEGEICFSHGDAHLDNIIVSGAPGSRRIAGIIDWGQAGWYPACWEYFNMLSFTWDHEWSQQGWINRVLKPYKEETEALSNYWSWKGPS